MREKFRWSGEERMNGKEGVRESRSEEGVKRQRRGRKEERIGRVGKELKESGERERK